MSASQRPVFECKRCGHCCSGEGGIILAPKDLRRLADYMNLSEQEFLEAYSERRCGKDTIIAGQDGYCVFFENGCNVHSARPDVCRAWPFFTGNMIDDQSLQMAKEDCPGIDPDVERSAFASHGLEYILALNVDISENGPNAVRMLGDFLKKT